MGSDGDEIDTEPLTEGPRRARPSPRRGLGPIGGPAPRPEALASIPTPPGVEILPDDRTFVEDYLARAAQERKGEFGAAEAEGVPQGIIQWQEATDMRSALTGRWQTFQSEFMRRGVDHHWDDEVYEWIEEQLDWWLAEADAASAGSGYTKPFAIVQGWKAFEKRAIKLNQDTLKARYMYLSLVNNRLGIGWHIEPRRDIAASMDASRELLKSLHYTDTAKRIEELQDENPEGLNLTDVAAIMVDQVFKQDRDVVAVFDAAYDNEFGNVGIGKSDLMLQMAALCAPKKFDLRYDIAYSIDVRRFDRHMRMAMSKKLDKGSLWGHDEAENPLFDRDHGKGRNKSRVKNFLRVRKRNQFIFLCCNSIWYLDNKMHPRITWRFRITDRGWVEVYRTAGLKFIDESEDKWGLWVTESPFGSLREARLDVRTLYERCVAVVDDAAARFDEDDDADVEELPTSPLDDLLTRNPEWGLDLIKEPFAGIRSIAS